MNYKDKGIQFPCLWEIYAKPVIGQLQYWRGQVYLSSAWICIGIYENYSQHYL
jgi:hypothetical protein